MTKPRPMTLGLHPGGALGMVYDDGQPVPPGQRITGTADDMARMIVAHAQAAIQAGRQAAFTESNAARQAETEHLADQVWAVIDKTAQITAQRYAQAGADAAVAHIAKSTILRRRIERDEAGRITGSVEERVLPVPYVGPSKTDAPYRREPRAGFRPANRKEDPRP